MVRRQARLLPETCLPADAVCAADAFANVSSANDLVLPVHTQPGTPSTITIPAGQSGGWRTGWGAGCRCWFRLNWGMSGTGWRKHCANKTGSMAWCESCCCRAQLMEQRAPQESGSSAAWVLRVERESVGHEPQP